MLVYEFGWIRLQDENELLKRSVDILTSENQTLLAALEQAKSNLIVTQKKATEDAVFFASRERSLNKETKQAITQEDLCIISFQSFYVQILI